MKFTSRSSNSNVTHPLHHFVNGEALEVTEADRQTAPQTHDFINMNRILLILLIID